MGSFAAVYVYGVDRSRLRSVLGAERTSRVFRLRRLTGGDCEEITSGDLYPPDLAGRLSAHFGCRAIALETQSAVDWAELHVYWKGNEVRHLEWSSGDGWSRVEGRRDSWEQDLFLDIPYDDELLSALDREALSTRRLVEGARVPSGSGESMGAALGLPGFSVGASWEPNVTVWTRRGLSAVVGGVAAAGLVLAVLWGARAPERPITLPPSPVPLAEATRALIPPLADPARNERYCDTGNGTACFTLARHNERQGVDATDLYERACSLGIGVACTTLAERRPDERARLLEQACRAERPDPSACP